ncbi:MAG: elongation factor P, partial [Phenylobacterium sp.]|nr:elongation factor P [Phenylobacterium sp.]
FRTSDTVEQIHLDQKEYSFLYEQGDMLVFMDQETYEQIELAKDFVGDDQVRFLQDGMVVKLQLFEERPISITLPEQVVLVIVEADAVVKNQTASSSYKPAKADNGMRILIPPYMEAGERVLVSTETGEYLRRAD